MKSISFGPSYLSLCCTLLMCVLLDFVFVTGGESGQLVHTASL